MKNYSLKSMLLDVDFGDIDGLFDPNLTRYFIDFGFSEQIVNKDIFFVIGRKGCGKSAIYNYVNSKQEEGDFLCSNMSFKEFPFEKFLQLSDDDFSRPNQYQSIWRNIILSQFSKLITLDEKKNITTEYKMLYEYVEYHFGLNIVDLHKQITRNTSKTSSGLLLGNKNIANASINAEASREKTFGLEINNISQINIKLEEILLAYLTTSNTSEYIIQFDQLDDNYTTYIDRQEYFQSIISLFKTIYDVNMTFRQKGIKAKAVAYLRSDIYYSINSFDSESARWQHFLLPINYAIISKNDWNNPRLLQIVNKRISTSNEVLANDTNPFNTIFDNTILKLKDHDKIQDPFKYLIHRSFHRPRDIIQFCIYIQNEVKEKDDFFFKTIKDAETKYSVWLLSEIENELAPMVEEIHVLYEFLRLLGEKAFNLSNFKRKYSSFRNTIGIDSEALLKMLYKFGIIHNVQFKYRSVEMYSIVRNENSVFNRDLMIELHSGIAQGLYTTKFMV